MGWKKVIVDYELQDMLQRLDEKKARLDAHRPLNPYITKNIKDSLALEWTYNSNSIEGNTLTLQETKIILEEGITVKGKTLREHFEAVNHQDAIDYVESLVDPAYSLRAQDILKVHSLILDKIEKEIAGRYRTGGVRISGANFVPPNALKIDAYIDDLIQWVHQDVNKLHPIIMASVFHHRFVWIHPFFDGNGRTIRLLFNLLLMQVGYPPAIILRVDRKKYYTALNSANNGEYTKLFFLIIQAAERSLNLYLNAVEDNFDAYKPISQIAKEPDAPYGQEYLSLLARRGKLDAYKEGKVWYVSEDAIQAYRDARKRKR